MMKKTGFTLAEVLITLAIIGVVATLTLPTLMTNTGEQQYKAGIKKALNTLSEVGQMSSALEGFDYSSISQTSTAGEIWDGEVARQSLLGMIGARAQIDVGASGTQGPKNDESNFAIYFRDGSMLVFDPNATSSAQEFSEGNERHGIAAYVDVNGNRGPNLFSNCNASGAANPTATTPVANSHGANTCAEKIGRVIKDRFAVRLVGSAAIPNDAAAAWALQN